MKLKTLVGSLALLGMATHTLAQTAQPQRIEITGSSIKRTASEGALPIQVIRFEELARNGISSAEQLVATLSSNGPGIDNLATNQGGDFLNSTAGKSANNGSSAASLRGLGAQYTLVLLNGRRLSTHGLNGQSVDLNSIPLAAIDRVEILKDGASAIYGTDAIGGVINFILKKDYTGLEASAFIDRTQHGGGNISQGTVTFGAGNSATDRFNVMASLSFKTNDRLRGSQRSFHDGIQPERGLAADTTGTPFAGIGTGSGTALGGSFALPGAFGQPGMPTNYNRVNLLALQGKCDTIQDTSVYRGDITGFPRNNASCAYDYGKQWSLMQPVDTTSLVAKGTFAITPQHSVFLEATGSQTKSAVEYTPIQLTNNNYRYPASGPYYQNLAVLAPTYFKSTNTDATDKRVYFNASLPEIIRWRCLPCGPRQQDTTTDAARLLLGAEGAFGAWDYKLGFSSGQSKATTKLGDGMMFTDKLIAAMATGKINPFLQPGESQTAEALALLEGAKAKGGSLYGGKASVQQIDGTVSGELFALPAGPVSMAVGFDSRKEDFRFNDNTGGTQPAINGVGAPPTLDVVKRTINAVFTEVQIPLFKGVDLNLAARHDRYNDFGGTTNPKASLRWQVAPEFVIRGSYSRGFHAPDFNALYGGGSDGAFNSDINDPVLCPTGKEARGCGIRPGINVSSNPKLKPERSKQFSLGFVVEPFSGLSATVDFWRIDLTDRISVLSGQALIKNYQQYSQYVKRNAAGEIESVDAPYLNLAGDQTQGVDINLTSTFKTSVGTITAALDGTYTDSYKSRFSRDDPWSQRMGEFGDSTYGWALHLRWKHTASVSWSQGDWSSTLSQSYSSGYRAEVDGFGSGVVPPGYVSTVKPYMLFNLSATYKGIKNLSLTAGVKNLFDKDPSFSGHNVDNVAGAGWDARVGDPRGRAFTLLAKYKFF
jgi:iron complex outermembrane recepter protein